ncbi:conserved hypothetical protein [Neospora caninum Liverpool]|uniref:HORMA domain-containing protein n=1 Tax=Neospora caninum (strain Liverpool) TaxID=572307 RepID=F0VEC7_NEOCL|nr:conserved hypothetical protein [Neospora caninum Liverpool]CBZ52071.1 conserved hypothetical protein [Neospora caninum Liverpool]|eukprot:XP_003882103.1 conserved hypothetical protein [Neospora caninum Liverpool]
MLPMSAGGADTVDTLVAFLEAWFHHLLCLRGVYPAAFFRRVRLFGQFVWWSQAKAVSSYIRELCISLRESLQRRLLPLIRLAIFDKNNSVLEWFDFCFSYASSSFSSLTFPQLSSVERCHHDGGEPAGAALNLARNSALGCESERDSEREGQHSHRQDGETKAKPRKSESAAGGRFWCRKRWREFEGPVDETPRAGDEDGDDVNRTQKSRRRNPSSGPKERNEFPLPEYPAEHFRDVLTRLEVSSFWIDDFREEGQGEGEAPEHEDEQRTRERRRRSRQLEKRPIGSAKLQEGQALLNRRKACAFRIFVEVDPTVLSRLVEARKSTGLRPSPSPPDEDLHAVQRLRCSWMPSLPSFSPFASPSWASSACLPSSPSGSAPALTRPSKAALPLDRETEVSVLVSAFPFCVHSSFASASSLAASSPRGFLAVFASVPTHSKKATTCQALSRSPSSSTVLSSDYLHEFRRNTPEIQATRDRKEGTKTENKAKHKTEKAEKRRAEANELEAEKANLWLAAADLVGFPERPT